MDLKDIKAIIDLMKKNDLSVFEMEKDGFRLKLCKGLGDQPIMMSSTAPAAANGPTGAAAASAGTESASTKEIVSPMVGTFYRSASPDSSPFVDVGTGWNNIGGQSQAASMETLPSVGVGLIFDPERHVHAQLYWGYAFNRDVLTNGNNLQDYGIHFLVSVNAF